VRQSRRAPTTASTASGGWQSREDYHGWAGRAAAPLLARVIEVVRHATQQLFALYRPEERTHWSVATWSNIYHKGDFHRSHSHPGSTWSGAYYVDPGAVDPKNPQSGTLALFNPNVAAPMSFYRASIPMRYVIHPEPGLIMHPYTGRTARVSVTFNVKKEPYP